MNKMLEKKIGDLEKCPCRNCKLVCMELKNREAKIPICKSTPNVNIDLVKKDDFNVSYEVGEKYSENERQIIIKFEFVWYNYCGAVREK